MIAFPNKISVSRPNRRTFALYHFGNISVNGLTIPEILADSMFRMILSQYNGTAREQDTSRQS